MAIAWLFRSWRLVALIAAALLAAWPPAPVAAPSEYEVKLAFIYNFTQYIEWPGELAGTDHFNFCLLGENPFGRALDTVRAKQAKHLPIAVHLLTGPQASQDCHLIFIAAFEPERLAPLLRALERPGLLTITDLPDGERAGAIITLKRVADKVRFAVNPARARAARLSISAQLLKLAEIVE